jgi:hypothetical protein
MFIDSAIASINRLVTSSRLLLLALLANFAMLASPASAMPASLVRISRIAESISGQLLGLLLICVIVGLNLFADRRRRSRVQSSHS